MRKISCFIFIIIFFLLTNIILLYAQTATLNVTVKRIDNNNTTDKITWAGVTPGVTNWKSAEQYLEIHYFCDYSGWGMQIFNDNTVGGVSGVPYPFTGTYVVDPNNNPSTPPNAGSLAGDLAAGLVYENGKHTLPICWRVTFPAHFASGSADLNIQETTDHHLRRNITESYNCWIWMKDKANDGWSDPIVWRGRYYPNPTIKWEDGMLYATAVCSEGIQHGEMSFDGWGIGPLDGQTDGLYGILVYLGAKFERAAGGDYQTKIYVQMYHE